MRGVGWFVCGLFWGVVVAKNYYVGGIFTAFWKGLTAQ